MKILEGLTSRIYEIAVNTLARWKPHWRFECDKRIHSAAFPLAENHNLNQLYRIFIMEDYFVFDSVERKDFFVWLIFQLRQRAGPGEQPLTP